MNRNTGAHLSVIGLHSAPGDNPAMMVHFWENAAFNYLSPKRIAEEWEFLCRISAVPAMLEALAVTSECDEHTSDCADCFRYMDGKCRDESVIKCKAALAAAKGDSE